MSNRRWTAVVAAMAVMASACSSGSATSAPPAATGTAAPPTAAASGTRRRPARAPACPPRWARARASWTSSSGPATPRTAPTTRNTTGSTPSSRPTGCAGQRPRPADTSDDMYNLMPQNHGLYDGVSASGDASNRLIDNGEVAPINVNLIPDFVNISPVPAEPGPQHGQRHALRRLPRLGRQHPDVQHGRFHDGADELGVGLRPDPGRPLKGKITDYDSPIYIADAALYLKTAQPSLGITDPYELTQPQFDAAVALLTAQQPFVGKYWSLVLGRDRQLHATAPRRSGRPGRTRSTRSRPTRRSRSRRSCRPRA